MIHNFKTSLFTHGLNLTDQLTYKTFFDQFRSQSCIHNNCHVVIPLGHKAFCLRHGNQQILFQ